MIEDIAQRLYEANCLAMGGAFKTWEALREDLTQREYKAWIVVAELVRETFHETCRDMIADERQLSQLPFRWATM